MKFKCPATHVLWSFGTQNSIVTFIFKFDPRKGQLKVKLGQTRSNFKIQNFFSKYAYLGQFCLRVPKKSFIFIYGKQECQNLHFKNMTSLLLPFFGHCTVKNKDIALKFGMHVVCMHLDYIYSAFWITVKFWFLQAIIFQKFKF